MDHAITHQRRLDDRWCMAAYVLTMVAVLGSLGAILLPRETFLPFYAHSAILMPVLPVLAAWRAWHRDREATGPTDWRWAAIGIFMFAAHEVAWYLIWLQGRPFDSMVTDVLSIICAPLVLIGLLRGHTALRDAQARQREYLDASIVAIAAASIVHALMTLLGGGIRPVHDLRDLLAVVTPAVDLLTLGGIGLLWVRRGSGGVPGWTASIGVALLLGFVGDIWYAMPASLGVEAPGFVTAAWYGYWAALAIGATRAVYPAPLTLPVVRISRLPYVLVIVCFAALVTAVAVDDRAAIVSTTIGAAIVTLLVLVRQLAAVRDVTQMEAERAQTQADVRLAALVRHGSDMLTIVNPDLTIQYASRRTA